MSKGIVYIKTFFCILIIICLVLRITYYNKMEGFNTTVEESLFFRIGNCFDTGENKDVPNRKMCYDKGAYYSEDERYIDCSRLVGEGKDQTTEVGCFGTNPGEEEEYPLYINRSRNSAQNSKPDEINKLADNLFPTSNIAEGIEIKNILTLGEDVNGYYSEDGLENRNMLYIDGKPIYEYYMANMYKNENSGAQFMFDGESLPSDVQKDYDAQRYGRQRTLVYLYWILQKLNTVSSYDKDNGRTYTQNNKYNFQLADAIEKRPKLIDYFLVNNLYWKKTVNWRGEPVYKSYHDLCQGSKDCKKRRWYRREYIKNINKYWGKYLNIANNLALNFA